MNANDRATKRQQELLQFIDDFIREHGYGPSYREIMRGIGYKSVSTVAVHVEGLITKGYLARKDNSARSLEVIGLSSQLHSNDESFPSPNQHLALTRLLEVTTDESDRTAIKRTIELLRAHTTPNSK